MLKISKILSIARAKDSFFVAPHYRFDKLRRRCKKLCKKGLLKRSHWKKHGRYGDYFVSTEKTSEGIEFYRQHGQ